MSTIDPLIAPTDMIADIAVDAAPSRSSATTVRSAGSAVATSRTGLERLIPGAHKSAGAEGIGNYPLRALSVGGLFHFRPSARCRLLARRRPLQTLLLRLLVGETGVVVLIASYSGSDPNAKRRHFRYVVGIAVAISVSPASSSAILRARGRQANGGCCLGLIRIEPSSVAAAIITRMPAKLSAICIASSSEMLTSVIWLASARRTPRQ